METVKEKLTKLIEYFDEQGYAQIICDSSKVCEECQHLRNGCIFARIAEHLIQNGVTIATDTNVGDKWVKTSERKNCPMRHENGNCLPAGGFCTAVNDLICDALHNAYENGRCSVATDTNDKWVGVDERLPEESDSMFAKYYGTEKWGNAMFRKCSDDVIVCIEYEDGSIRTGVARTLDGKWNLKGVWKMKVTHWMPFPQPPKGGVQ